MAPCLPSISSQTTIVCGTKPSIHHVFCVTCAKAASSAHASLVRCAGGRSQVFVTVQSGTDSCPPPEGNTGSFGAFPGARKVSLAFKNPPWPCDLLFMRQLRTCAFQPGEVGVWPHVALWLAQFIAMAPSPTPSRAWHRKRSSEKRNLPPMATLGARLVVTAVMAPQSPCELRSKRSGGAQLQGRHSDDTFDARRAHAGACVPW